MPIIGLASGLRIKCSQQQFKALTTNRSPYAEGQMIDLQDENRKPVGKIKASSIEYVAPDNSSYFGDAPVVATAPIVPQAKAVEVPAKKSAPAYKSKTYGKKK